MVGFGVGDGHGEEGSRRRLPSWMVTVVDNDDDDGRIAIQPKQNSQLKSETNTSNNITCRRTKSSQVDEKKRKVGKKKEIHQDHDDDNDGELTLTVQDLLTIAKEKCGFFGERALNLNGDELRPAQSGRTERDSEFGDSNSPAKQTATLWSRRWLFGMSKLIEIVISLNYDHHQTKIKIFSQNHHQMTSQGSQITKPSRNHLMLQPLQLQVWPQPQGMILILHTTTCFIYFWVHGLTNLPHETANHDMISKTFPSDVGQEMVWYPYPPSP